MIRQFFGLIHVACCYIWPPDIYVRDRVDAAGADALAEFEAEHDVMPPIRFGPVVDSIPCQPVVDQPEHVAELVRYHHVVANQPDGVYCACHHRSHNDRRHAHHVAQLVEDMLTADARLANKFQR